MEICYRAYDGKIFSNASDCEKHEKESPLFELYDEKGLTSNIDGTDIVVLYGEEGARAFINICEEEGYCYDGIDPNDYYGDHETPYVMMWDCDQCVYVLIPDDALSAVGHYLSKRKSK